MAHVCFSNTKVKKNVFLQIENNQFVKGFNNANN